MAVAQVKQKLITGKELLEMEDMEHCEVVCRLDGMLFFLRFVHR